MTFSALQIISLAITQAHRYVDHRKPLSHASFCFPALQLADRTLQVSDFAQRLTLRASRYIYLNLFNYPVTSLEPTVSSYPLEH